MKCFYCSKQACAKIGVSKGNILKALFGAKCWSKKEFYVCRKHFDDFEKEELKRKAERDVLYSGLVEDVRRREGIL